jgi:hypothetical protein
VAEALNETMCGCRDCHCPGLVVRGTFQMLLQPSKGSAATIRAAEVLQNEPLLLLAARGADVLEWASRFLFRGGDPGNGEIRQAAADGTQTEQRHGETDELSTNALVVKKLVALSKGSTSLAHGFIGAPCSHGGHKCTDTPVEHMVELPRNMHGSLVPSSVVLSCPVWTSQVQPSATGWAQPRDSVNMNIEA